MALPLPPLVFPGNQKLPNGKTPGYVPTLEEEIKAADKGKPISGGDADSGLLTNFGDQVKEFGDKITDRGMQALCQVNPLACASNVIMQSGDNTFSSGGKDIHIDDKIGNQIGPRGWTEQDIRTVINRGPVGSTTDNRSATKT